MNDPYRQFLEGKVKLDQGHGFDVDMAEINPHLKPHTRAIVKWALRGGRRAIFAAFGLHKTATQIEIMRLLGRHRPGRIRLITMPLGMRTEFPREAAQRFKGEHQVDLRFIRRNEEIGDDRTIYLTNYESIREGILDPTGFDTSLDEASVLRGFGGTKTFREFMRLFEHQPTYRFVATATPSPNEYVELLAYAAYLGVMDVGQAKTRFFKRNSEKADQLTIHPHKEREFWLWVSSWAIFLQKPSDLGFSDEGYELPPLDVRWHEIPSDHSAAGTEKDGQHRLLKNTSIGVQDAAREKRESLPARVAKLIEIRAEAPAEHRIIWHDLEDERRAIEAAVPGISTVYGSQDLDEREAAVCAFADGEIAELAAKPVMLGSGNNFQRHCWWEVFLGIGFKFNDFIQGIYRVQRFGQTHPVRIDLIYTEAERDVRRRLEEKWARDNELREKMAEIIRTYGLNQAAISAELTRAIGVERTEASGNGYCLIRNDNVPETRAMAADSVDLIVTSLPFSNQYEYSPNYADFGHTDDNAHFWAQMDFLIPELYRVLKPGRVACIHVKDRITPSGISGLGFQIVTPFSDETVAAFRKHGFGFLSRITVVTDVVRENNQTYRLGWSEQCKDGSRMGNGMPEYVLKFRKPPTDRTNGYADVPVVKDKASYTRARWQFDAHGYHRSSGNRVLQPEELVGLPQEQVFKMFREYSLSNVYDFEHNVRIANDVDATGWLPSTFMLLQPQSWHPEVWTDITRMLTLNGQQHAKGKEMHLCPLQFDIVDRCIEQHSMPGEEVYDPFGGLGTVPYRALKLRRRGRSCELSHSYWLDSLTYCQAAAREMSMPDLFAALEQAA
jgi:DNA modification methylase